MYLFGNGLIKCLQCNGKYRGKMIRKHASYTCSTYQKMGKDACTNFIIKQEEIEHIVKTHLQLKGKSINKPLGEFVDRIEVLNGGYRIKYKDKSESVINGSSDAYGYGTKFKY